jgi:hypothetical protein
VAHCINRRCCPNDILSRCYGFNVTDRRRHPLFPVICANQSAAEDVRDAMIEALDRAVEVIVP